MKKIDYKKILNRGSYLHVLDKLPFKVKRIYYYKTLKKKYTRYGHAHKKLKQVYICLSGSFQINMINRNKNKTTKVINKNNPFVIIKENIWREIIVLKNKSSLLVLASENYKESDYIRNLSEFLQNKK